MRKIQCECIVKNVSRNPPRVKPEYLNIRFETTVFVSFVNQLYAVSHSSVKVLKCAATYNKFGTQEGSPSKTHSVLSTFELFAVHVFRYIILFSTTC